MKYTVHLERCVRLFGAAMVVYFEYLSEFEELLGRM